MRLQERRPGGFTVAALLRPPDTAVGEDEVLWVERAREAATRGPLGHHTHWTSPTHARPTGDDEPGGRVLLESAWLRERDVRPTLFCGGGWYTDVSVAQACAELGYVDCTLRPSRPAYLAQGQRWAALAGPAWIRTVAGRFFAVPTTRTIGELTRVVLRPSGLPETVVHVYLHDTDLVDTRRRAALTAGMVALGRRRVATDLDTLASEMAGEAPEIEWASVARGAGGDGTPQ